MQKHWRIIGETVKGASHERDGRPNQDAISWLPDGWAQPPLILAVADGHGSASYFRSNIGSELAVETALEVCSQSFQQDKKPNTRQMKGWIEEQLPKEIVRTWKSKVAAHILVDPFTSEEIELLQEKVSFKKAQQIALDPIIAYGSTLLITLVDVDYVIYLVLGDGDILLVSDDGEVTRPLPKDESLIGDETFSLCESDAWRRFQFGIEPLQGNPPALILASTDGYGKAFVDDEAFLEVGTNYLKFIRDNGLDVIEKKLGSYLQEAASTKGSGDDVTLGIIARQDSLMEQGIQDDNQESSHLACDGERDRSQAEEIAQPNLNSEQRDSLRE